MKRLYDFIRRIPKAVVVTSQYDTTSTTLANVTGLSISVVPATYTFRAVLYTTSNVAGGVKAAISGTCTATSIAYEGLTFSGAAIGAETRATALGTAVGGVTAVTAALMTIEGTIVVATAGTLTAQFAANAAVGTSSVLINSMFQVKMV